MKKWRENSKAKMGGQTNWRKDKNNPKNKKNTSKKSNFECLASAHAQNMEYFY